MPKHILILPLLLAAAPISALNSDNSYDAARQSFDEKDFQTAAGQFADLVVGFELEYKDVEGPLYCAQNDAQIASYRKLIERDGKGELVDWRFCSSLFHQAFSYSEIKRVDLAVGTLRRAVEIAPLAINYRIEFAYALGQAKRFDEANANYEHALEMAREASAHADEATALRGLGYIAIEQGHWDSAEDFYRQSLTIDPESSVAASEMEYIGENRPR